MNIGKEDLTLYLSSWNMKSMGGLRIREVNESFRLFLKNESCSIVVGITPRKLELIGKNLAEELKIDTKRVDVPVVYVSSNPVLTPLNKCVITDDYRLSLRRPNGIGIILLPDDVRGFRVVDERRMFEAQKIQGTKGKGLPIK